jgi:hypothetical protein
MDEDCLKAARIFTGACTSLAARLPARNISSPRGYVSQPEDANEWLPHCLRRNLRNSSGVRCLGRLRRFTIPTPGPVGSKPHSSFIFVLVSSSSGPLRPAADKINRIPGFPLKPTLLSRFVPHLVMSLIGYRLFLQNRFRQFLGNEIPGHREPVCCVLAACSNAATRASASSISIALAAKLKVASAARTRTAGAVAESIIVFGRVVDDDDVPC